jgi:hypothetical protein
MSDPRVVVRYISASKQGTGPLIAVQQDLPKMIVAREAALPLEYGVTGSELRRRLREGIEEFIKAMEAQGLTLIPLPSGNPLVVTLEDGTPLRTYSFTKDLEKSAVVSDPSKTPEDTPTLKVPSSLEESGGYVDYRIVGVFWAPQVTLEILKSREQIKEEERQARNPRSWGYGSTLPNRPSIA